MKQKINKAYKALSCISLGRVYKNYTLAKQTSFKIGGKALLFYLPANLQELQSALKVIAKLKLPIFILGQGTNVLVSDKGIKAVVIKLSDCCKYINISGLQADVGAGVGLGQLIKTTLKKGLGGLEFLSGIPGTVGGALVMNAGLKNHWLGERVLRVKAMNKSGTIKDFTAEQLKFRYRSSRFNSKNWIILSVVLKLIRSRPADIQEKINTYMKKRKASQPLGIPNAGSIFKNPKTDFAGRLLEIVGCKGMKVGNAMVSKKHANFIVNLGNAKAVHVLALMQKMKKKVLSRFGVQLISEVEMVGFN